MKVIEVKTETIELNKKISLGIFAIALSMILIVVESFIIITVSNIVQNILIDTGYKHVIQYQSFLIIIIISNLLFFTLGWIIAKYW